MEATHEMDRREMIARWMTGRWEFEYHDPRIMERFIVLPPFRLYVPPKPVQNTSDQSR